MAAERAHLAPAQRVRGRGAVLGTANVHILPLSAHVHHSAVRRARLGQTWRFLPMIRSG